MIVADRVKETTTSTGTGALTLEGAAEGYRAFSSAFQAGDVVPYCVSGVAQWEVGEGEFNLNNSLGSSFSIAAPPSGTGWVDIVFGGGKFIAINTTGNSGVAYSTDGLSWSVSAPLISNVNSWIACSYGNGVFVAITNGSNVAASSTDGTAWIQRALPTGFNGVDVTFGAGVFVAISNSSIKSATSIDGSSWTERTLPSSSGWTSVAYGNGVFVAVSSVGNAAATSPDGITWTARTLPSSSDWKSVVYGNGTFVAVSSGGNAAATSPDGITWTARTLPSSASWGAVHFCNGVFVATTKSAITTIAAYSSDGISWTAVTLPVSKNWQSISYGAGRAVIIGYGDGLLYSDDAFTGLSMLRTTVLSSSNANALVNFSAGTKDVFCTLPANRVFGDGPPAVLTNGSAWIDGSALKVRIGGVTKTVTLT